MNPVKITLGLALLINSSCINDEDLVCGDVIENILSIANEIATKDAGNIHMRSYSVPDPEADAKWCREQIISEGFAIRQRRSSSMETTTTYPPVYSMLIPGRVLLKYGFDEFTWVQKARALCHELVHVRTEKRRLAIGTAYDYMQTEERLGWEIAAWTINVALSKNYDDTHGTVNFYVGWAAGRIFDKYKIENISKDCVETTARYHWSQYIDIRGY